MRQVLTKKGKGRRQKGEEIKKKKKGIAFKSLTSSQSTFRKNGWPLMSPKPV